MTHPSEWPNSLRYFVVCMTATTMTLGLIFMAQDILGYFLSLFPIVWFGYMEWDGRRNIEG